MEVDESYSIVPDFPLYVAHVGVAAAESSVIVNPSYIPAVPAPAAVISQVSTLVISPPTLLKVATIADASLL